MDGSDTPPGEGEPSFNIWILVSEVPLGLVVATPGALEALEQCGQHAEDFLARHGNGDWGEVDSQDWATNDEALRSGERLLSAYTLSAGTKLWIITEADRSATTLLLPSEY